MSLQGRRALVTGASSGIGEATAHALAGLGVQVALSGRDPAALARVAAAIGRAPRRRPGAVATGAALGEEQDPGRQDVMAASATRAVVTMAADLRQPQAAATLVGWARAELGGLDIVISNAGAGWAGAMSTMDPALIDELIDLNLRAPTHLVAAALPVLLAAGHGHLVFVGSIAGRLGVPGEVVYSSTKAGLGGLAEALRSELIGTGVQVSLITPGVVDTAFFARRGRAYSRRHPRPVAAEVVAEGIVDCLESGRPEVVIPRWLTLPIRLQGTFPQLYRRLAHRLG